MKEIGAFDAKNKLAELLDTRHGKQVARLGPVQKPFDREAARRAVATIKALREAGPSVDDKTIKDYINEGRP